MYRKLTIAVMSAAILSTTGAAYATYIPPYPIGSVEKREVAQHERIRKQQVRQNSGRPILEPIFAPFYKGYDSPMNQLDRAVR